MASTFAASPLVLVGSVALGTGYFVAKSQKKLNDIRQSEFSVIRQHLESDFYDDQGQLQKSPFRGQSLDAVTEARNQRDFEVAIVPTTMGATWAATRLFRVLKATAKPPQ